MLPDVDAARLDGICPPQSVPYLQVGDGLQLLLGEENTSTVKTWVLTDVQWDPVWARKPEFLRFIPLEASCDLGKIHNLTGSDLQHRVRMTIPTSHLHEQSVYLN